MNERSKCLAAALALAVAWSWTLRARAGDPEPARFEEAIRAFEAWDRQNSPPRDAVLFVGSSSIRLWPTAESFPDLAVINRGFGGSVIADSIHFAPRIVIRYHPRVIVFYAGDNDIASGMSPDKVLRDFRAFVDLVHKELPDARIIFLPIKPSLARWPKWPRMKEANTLVAKLAKSDDRVDYVDTATPMLGADGRPRRKLFLEDGLHLNEQGYVEWTEGLDPALRSAMSQR